MCALGSGGLGGGNSAASLLRTLLMDAPERARIDRVSRFCWRCFGEAGEEAWALPLPFLSEDEETSGEVWGRREPIAVSDLYRGRVGGAFSFADDLTPAETECDRRRTMVDGAAGDCVIGGGDLGKVMVASESEDWDSCSSESTTAQATSSCSFAGGCTFFSGACAQSRSKFCDDNSTLTGSVVTAKTSFAVEGVDIVAGVIGAKGEMSMVEEASTSLILVEKHPSLLGIGMMSMTILEAWMEDLEGDEGCRDRDGETCTRR